MAYNSTRTKEIHRLLNQTIITPEQLFTWTEKRDNDILWDLLQPLANYLKHHKPAKLYRLRNDSPKSIDAFSKDQVYLSRADYFNDPYDCMLHFDEDTILQSIKSELTEENLRNFFSHTAQTLTPDKQSELSEKWLPLMLLMRDTFMEGVSHILPSVNTYLQQDMEVACFTEDVTSPIMWSHYAKNHEGFAIEYQFRSNMFWPHPYSVPDVAYDWYGWRSLLPVLYSDKRKDGSALANWYSLCITRDQIGFGGKGNDLSRFLPDSLLKTKLGLHKASAWQYELEWRLIFSTEWPNKVKEGTVHIEYPASAVYLGCNTDKDVKKELIKMAKSKGIPAFQMYIDYSSEEYKLSYRPAL